MSRRYDSSRRKEQARQTRRQILDAAVALHAQGIMAYEALAEAAGVSLATVRKHFPNKEAVFQGCTQHFFESFEPPLLAAAAALRDPGERSARVVAEMCRANESTYELVWHGHTHVSTSPALAAALEALGAIVQAAADVVIDGAGLRLRGKARDRARASIRALLDPITYRAFRVQAGLAAEAAQRQLTVLVAATVGVTVPASSPRSS